MEIKGKNYELKLTGLTLVVYKEEFGKDMLSSISNEISAKDITSLMELLWALLKTTDSSFPNYKTWMDSMELNEITDVLSSQNISEITKAISIKRTKELKKK